MEVTLEMEVETATLEAEESTRTVGEGGEITGVEVRRREVEAAERGEGGGVIGAKVERGAEKERRMCCVSDGCSGAEAETAAAAADRRLGRILAPS